MKYTIEEKTEIVESIKYLTRDEHNEIFKLICQSGVPYNENQNGVFIDFDLVGDELITKIKMLIKFFEENKERLKESDRIQEDYKKSITKKETPIIKEEIVKIEQKEIAVGTGAVVIVPQKMPTRKKVKYNGIRDKIMKNLKTSKKVIKHVIEEEEEEGDVNDD